MALWKFWHFKPEHDGSLLLGASCCGYSVFVNTSSSLEIGTYDWVYVYVFSDILLFFNDF